MASHKTTQEYIHECKGVYGDAYQYNKTEYLHCRLPITITCKIHNDFEIGTAYFLKGGGCPHCRKDKRSRTQWTTESLVEKLKEVQPNKDYSKVKYLTTKDKIEVVCPRHGSYFNTPENLIKGQDCKKCRRVSKKKHSLKHYIDKANQIHKYKYDYSLIKDFSGCLDKVPIICPEHGTFYQPIGYHARGTGCWKCGMEYIKNSFKNFHKNRFLGGVKKSEWLSIQKGRRAKLYVVRMFNDTESFLKIGITFNKIEQRLSQIKYSKEILFSYSSEDADFIFELEKNCKVKFKDHRILPSILFKGYTECFNVSITKELLAYLQ